MTARGCRSCVRIAGSVAGRYPDFGGGRYAATLSRTEPDDALRARRWRGERCDDAARATDVGPTLYEVPTTEYEPTRGRERASGQRPRRESVIRLLLRLFAIQHKTSA